MVNKKDQVFSPYIHAIICLIVVVWFCVSVADYLSISAMDSPAPRGYQREASKQLTVE